jgi:hypothetical protein
MALACERSMPTEQPHLVGEVVPASADRGVAWSAQRIPTVVNLSLVVIVSGYKSRGPGFDSPQFQIF